MAEPENRQKLLSQETLPSNPDYSPAGERDKPTTDWKGYSPETLHALDV